MQSAQQLELFFECKPVITTAADGSLTVRPGRVRRVGGVRFLGSADAHRMVPHVSRRLVQKMMAEAGAGQNARGGKRWIEPEAWRDYCASRGLIG